MKCMRLIRCLLLLLIVSVSQSVLAQANCYERTRQKGIDLYNKGDYQAAAKNFEAAKFCGDLPDDNDLDSWLDKCVVNVKLSVKRLEFEALFNEEQTVEVTTKAKTFKVSKAPSWCTITQQGKMLIVYCEDNVVVAPREAKITITAAGKTAVLEIYQAAAEVELDLKPESVDFSSQSETRKVAVRSNVKEWSIDTTPEWLTVERKGDTLLLTSEKNASSAYRESELKIMIAEELFPLPVRQMPGDTVLIINKKEVVLPETYSDEHVLVTCNMAGWQVEPSSDWIEVTKRNDSIVVSVVENQSAFSRHGIVRFTCGTRHCDLKVHQRPHITSFVMPESELKSVAALTSDKESIEVTSIPSDLVVYVDDTCRMVTPFTIPVDYEHHSIQMGFERLECLLNERQQNIVFKPGLRFATITFTAPKNIGLRTGFISANGFGAYSHFAASFPLVKEFDSENTRADGYHFMVGPVYSPIQYAAAYAGIGFGIHEGPSSQGIPNVGFAFEAGAMGMFKNVMISLGFRNTRWGLNDNDHRTTFVLGVGGYLKRYYDPKLGYCASDSRRWWSLNYVTRPATRGNGLMFGDIGKGKARAYLKAMYAQPDESLKNVDASFGILFTPVNGIIDFCIGAGAGLKIGEEKPQATMEAEAGVILNIWRFPLTVMLHESDLLNDRHMYVDFGIGFHLGEFNRSSYK